VGQIGEELYHAGIEEIARAELRASRLLIRRSGGRPRKWMTAGRISSGGGDAARRGGRRR